MASTTASSAAGLMERIQANSVAKFVIGSRLYPACFNVASTNADVIQIPSIAPPSPQTSATTDGDAVTDVQISIAAKSLSPVQIADATLVGTRVLLGGSSIRETLYANLMNDVISGADYVISGQFDDFTDASNVSGVASWTVFQVSITDLMDIGYGNELVSAMSYKQWSLILASAGSIVIPNVNERYFTDLDVFRIGGVDVFPCPSGILRTDTTKVGAIWHKSFGVAFGYHSGDTVSDIMQGTGAPAPLVHLNESVTDVAQTKLSAMILGNATEIHASGGVAIKYALA